MAISNTEEQERIQTMASLFPFVCGICYEKFNKINIFYLHLQAHNQNTSDCFHICNDSNGKDQNVSDSQATKSIFQCGSCSKTFFSICTLHKHMQDIYDQGSYEFDQNSNTAFPKGEQGNICSRKEVECSQHGTEVSNKPSDASHELGNLDISSTKIHHVDNAKLKVPVAKTTKTRKKTKEKVKVENIPTLETENTETHLDKAACERIVNNVVSKLKNLDESVKQIKRPRGRPPKSNNNIVTNTTPSSDIDLNIKTSKVLINIEKTDVSKVKSKVSKIKKGCNVEELSKNKQKKRTVVNVSKKTNDKENADLDKKQNLDLLINGQIDEEIKPTQETEIHPEIYLDKNETETDKVSKEETNSKHEPRNNESDKVVKTNIKRVEAKARKKRKREGDGQTDGLTATEKKKIKKYFYTCNICNKTMGLSHKKRHNAIHTAAMEGVPKQQEFETCDICGKSIVKAGLKLHQALHSEDRPYLCDRCPKAFKLKSNLHHHKQIHEDFKPHACETCGKRFHRRTDLRFHMRVHTDERPVQCPQCPLRFRKTSTLNIHMKVHRGDKCYQCELCGKAFIRKDYLKRHMVWHNGQASHECQVCGKKFIEKGGLQRHVKIHSEERAHVCHLCGKAFILSTNLKQHVKKVHNSDKKKKSSLNTTTDVQEQVPDTENQTEMSSQNMPVLQEYKVTVTDDTKTGPKAEYHTLMPRMREFEVPNLTPIGQSRNYGISQEFTTGQPPFYSSTPVGLVQLPYHDSAMMSHIPLPARQINEMNGDVPRLGYTEQQQAVQTISMQYAVSEDNVQYTNM